MEPLGYYKWHWQAWRANRRVQRMTWQARGLYRELLDDFWKEGVLRDDHTYMAEEVCGCTLEEFETYWPEIAPCWREVDGGLANEKMEDQRTEKDRLRLANAKNGSAGAKAKMANAEHLPSERQASAKETPSKRHIEEREERERSASRSKVAEATEEDLEGTGIAVDDYKAHQPVRKLKKSPFASVDSRDRWIAQWRVYYAEGKDTADMINQMIANNWVGPVADKWKNRPKQDVEATPEEFWGKDLG